MAKPIPPHVREHADDELMLTLSNRITLAKTNTPANPYRLPKDVVDQMVKQAKRIGKMLGYSTWPGIY